MALGKIIREFGVKLSLAYDKGGFEQANSAVDKMSSTLKEIGFGAAAAAATIFGFAEATAGNAKDLELYSQTLGISAERLQELAYGAKIAANVNRDELMGALEGVSGTLDQVKRGNLEAGSTFTALGINVGSLVKSGARADQVMAVVADRLREIQDPIARTALASKVFGGAVGTKLLPYLLQGSAGMAKLGLEARNLGVVMSDKTLKSQAKFQDSLNRVLFVLKNISYMIGGELIKKLEPLVNKFQTWIVANRKLIATGIVEFVKALGWGLQQLLEFVIQGVDAFKSLSEYVGGTGNAIKGLIAVWAGFQIASMVVAVYGLATAFGTMAAALLGMAPEILIIGGVMVALHDGYKLLKGGDFKDTWIYQFFEYVKGLANSMGIISKVTSLFSSLTGGGPSGNMNFTGGAKYTGGAASDAIGGVGSIGDVKIENNITLPPGTTHDQAAGIIADANHDSIGHLTKQLRATQNATSGGVMH